MIEINESYSACSAFLMNPFLSKKVYISAGSDMANYFLQTASSRDYLIMQGQNENSFGIVYDLNLGCRDEWHQGYYEVCGGFGKQPPFRPFDANFARHAASALVEGRFKGSYVISGMYAWCLWQREKGELS